MCVFLYLVLYRSSLYLHGGLVSRQASAAADPGTVHCALWCPPRSDQQPPVQWPCLHWACCRPGEFMSHFTWKTVFSVLVPALVFLWPICSSIGLSPSLPVPTCSPVAGSWSGPATGCGLSGSSVQVWVPGFWLVAEEQTAAHLLLCPAPPESGVQHTCPLHQSGNASWTDFGILDRLWTPGPHHLDQTDQDCQPQVWFQFSWYCPAVEPLGQTSTLVVDFIVPGMVQVEPIQVGPETQEPPQLLKVTRGLDDDKPDQTRMDILSLL